MSVTRSDRPRARAAPPEPVEGTAAPRSAPNRRWSGATVAAIAAAALIVAGVVLRFLTLSPLWLDEALSVNIAALPLGDIPEALRHDGHPPLYYLLLHGWMELFGTGDGAVRALSGLFGVATLPLGWLAGRRLGGRRCAWITVLLLAVSPYALRYATETRMYSLVMALVLAGYLLVGDSLSRPRPVRLAAIALVTGALLLTHYWSLWLVAGTGMVLLVVAVRSTSPDRRGGARRALVAMAAGGVLFLPWVPSLLYQVEHTGTPWGEPAHVSSVVSEALADFGGGPDPEATLLGLALAVLFGLGLFGRPVDDRRVELDVRTRPEARAEAGVVAATVVVAVAAGYLTGSAFASRYLATVFPLVVLVAALGATRLAGPGPRAWLLAGVVALSLVGAARNVVDDRTQAAEVVAVVEEQGTAGDTVVMCPDQLGPAVDRELADRFRRVAYPDPHLPVERVDWADYADRNARADPSAFAGEVLDRAGDGTVWVAWRGEYKTFEGQCEALLGALAAARPGAEELVRAEPRQFYEPASLYRFPAP